MVCQELTWRRRLYAALQGAEFWLNGDLGRPHHLVYITRRCKTSQRPTADTEVTLYGSVSQTTTPLQVVLFGLPLVVQRQIGLSKLLGLNIQLSVGDISIRPASQNV